MPIQMLNDVYGSTLRDKTHKGPNQAGNKSLLAYRADLGVPGYTGFIPGPSSVVVPIKGAEHTGRPVTQDVKDRAAASTQESANKMSEYADLYRKKPSDTQPFSKTGGGYWFSQRQLTQGAPFVATTTYNAELLSGPDTTKQQLDRTQGLTCTIANYEAARQRSCSAQPTMKRTTLLPTRPATAVTSLGETVGYQTTYGAMVVKNPVTGGMVASGRERPPRDTRPHTVHGDPRYTVMPKAMAPGMVGSTATYTRDFGGEGSDPMEREAPNEKFQTRLATTRELSEGTTRNTNNLPGYTGHQPASKYHELARAHADAPDPRISAKNDMLLFSLDQYSRTRLPKYTGYKPQAPRNITLEQPSQGPTRETTQGSANHAATKYGVPPVDNTHYINSRAGLMNFFSSTGVMVSDNGLANAQCYYKLERPGDGRFKMSQPSKTTRYGSVFNPRSSLV